MATECDLLVVGAGISGGVAALSSLHNGAGKVLIADKGSRVGEKTSQKIDFAENTGLDGIIKELNLPIRHYSHKSKWYSPSNLCFTLESRIADCWLKRGPAEDSFEVKAIESAVAQGAELMLDAEILSAQDGVVTIKTKGQLEEVKAKTVIDAEGLNSRLAKSLRIFDDVDRTITRIIAQGVVGKNFNLEAGAPEIFFDSRLAPGSYVLVCKDPIDGLGYVIQGSKEGVATDKPRNFKKLTEKNEVLKAILKDAEITQNIGGTLYITKTMPQSVTAGNILFVGDSARLMDPFLHYGVKPAIISGYLAGKAAAGMISRGNDLGEYEKLVKKTLYPELKTQHTNRRVFDRLSDGDLNKLFKFLVDLGEEVDFDELFSTQLERIPLVLRTLFKNPSTIPLFLKLILVKYLG